jgi:hypothetical protein
MRSKEFVSEKWSAKYKRSINCNNPKGFSQRAHCQGRKKKTNEAGDGAVGYVGAHELAGGMFDKIKTKLKDGVIKLKQVLGTETEETKQMWAVLQRLAKGDKTVTPEEKKQATAQFFDLLKLAGLGAIFKFTFHIPFSTEGIYMVAKLINKYVGINILPSSLSEAEYDDLNKLVKNKLKAAGYKFIGSGYDAQVWMKDEGTVVKILMPKDDNSAHETFKTFYKLSKKLDAPNLPKFKKIDGEEVYNFSINNQPFVQYGMEQLHPLKKGSLDEYVVWMLADYAAKQLDWADVVDSIGKDSGKGYYPNAEKLQKEFAAQDSRKVKEYQLFYNTLRMLHKVGMKRGYGWDPHTENIMQRGDGTLVITDPYA